MTDDTISRTAALKGLEDLNIASFYEEDEHSKEVYTEVKAMLKALPSATDTNVGGNLIDRQAAIEVMRKAKDKSEAHRMLVQLQSAHPDFDAYCDRLWKNAYERGKKDAQPDLETLMDLALMMAKPIEFLDLSVRSYNGLKRRGIDTVAKVYELERKGELKKIRNIGEKSADEIEHCLNQYLASWKGGQDNGSD